MTILSERSILSSSIEREEKEREGEGKRERERERGRLFSLRERGRE